MKKLLVIMIVTMIIASAAPVFAAAYLITSPTGTAIGGANFVPSSNVRIQLSSNATNYAATSAHSSAASGPGFEFQIDNTFNGMTKKAWANQATSAWPDPVTSPTGTVAGFQ